VKKDGGVNAETKAEVEASDQGVVSRDSADCSADEKLGEN
jgi:hypothetical protein